MVKGFQLETIPTLLFFFLFTLSFFKMEWPSYASTGKGIERYKDEVHVKAKGSYTCEPFHICAGAGIKVLLRNTDHLEIRRQSTLVMFYPITSFDIRTPQGKIYCNHGSK